MRTQHLALTSLLIAVLVAASPLPLFAQTIQRSLHVSAVDRAGKPVSDLGPSDFVVREDGIAREVLKVARATDPMQIALLVDDSTASTDYVTDYRESLQAFVAAITGDTEATGKHSIALITVASRPTIRVDYTSDADRLLKTTGGLFPQDQNRQLDEVFGIKIDRVRRKRRPRAVLDALINGQDGEIPCARESPVVEDSLQIPQYGNQPIAARQHAVHKIRTGQCQQ